MHKRTYRAYDLRGELVICTWAVGAAQRMEEDVYQTRLNRGDFIVVEVTSEDPHERPFKMHPFGNGVFEE